MEVREHPGLMDYLNLRLGRAGGRGPEYSWECPFCLDEIGSESSKRKLRFNLEKIAFCCFRCGFRTTSLAYFFKQLNGGFVQVVEEEFVKGTIRRPKGRLDKVVKDILRTKTKQVRLHPTGLPRDMVDLTSILDTASLPLAQRSALYYLRETRGISDEIIERFQIGYCSSGKFANYLIFPVVQGGEIVYFFNRFAGKTDDYKSLLPDNVEGFYTKTDCLLNYDAVRGQAHIFLVEGPLDCTAYEYAIAVGGKLLDPKQLALIAYLVDEGLEEITVSMDSDAETVAAIVSQLSGIVPIVTALMLDEGDPDERRDELPDLIGMRRSPTLLDRVRMNMKAQKKGF